MCSKEGKKDKYGLWQVLFNKSRVDSGNDKWFDITSVSYYIDDILYSVERRTYPDTELWIRLVTSRK